jgi:hypothetical protein
MTTTDTGGDDATAAVPEVDLMQLTPREFELFMAGRASGLLEGMETGYARARADLEAELTAAHQKAARIVRAAAQLPEHPGAAAWMNGHRPRPSWAAPARNDGTTD